MLTRREFEQLTAAIDAMDSINIVGSGRYVMAHNVKAMLQRWSENLPQEDALPVAKPKPPR